MANPFATFHTNEMCAILTEVGIEVPVKSRIFVIKLLQQAIADGRVDFIDGKLRAITPVRKRTTSKPSIEKLLLRDGVVTDVAKLDSPRVETMVKKINMESPRTNEIINTSNKVSPRLVN